MLDAAGRGVFPGGGVVVEEVGGEEVFGARHGEVVVIEGCEDWFF